MFEIIDSRIGYCIGLVISVDPVKRILFNFHRYVNMEHFELSAILVNNYNGEYNEQYENCFFENKNDVKNALEWLETLLVLVKLRGEECV